MFLTGKITIKVNKSLRCSLLSVTHLVDKTTDGGAGFPSSRKTVSHFGSFTFQKCISENNKQTNKQTSKQGTYTTVTP